MCDSDLVNYCCWNQIKSFNNFRRLRQPERRDLTPHDGQSRCSRYAAPRTHVKIIAFGRVRAGLVDHPKIYFDIFARIRTKSGSNVGMNHSASWFRRFVLRASSYNEKEIIWRSSYILTHISARARRECCNASLKWLGERLRTFLLGRLESHGKNAQLKNDLEPMPSSLRKESRSSSE